MANQHPDEFEEISNDDLQKEEENTKPSKDKKPDRDDLLTAGHDTPEITTNDGSVIETLDTAFHGTPGWSDGENISGSNRADYYEARSNGKSDSEEEVDEIRSRNKPSSSWEEGPDGPSHFIRALSSPKIATVRVLVLQYLKLNTSV